MSVQYSLGFYDDLESPAGPIQAEVRGLFGSGEKKLKRQHYNAKNIIKIIVLHSMFTEAKNKYITAVRQIYKSKADYSLNRLPGNILHTIVCCL